MSLDAVRLSLEDQGPGMFEVECHSGLDGLEPH